jgi:mycothiol synthase
VTSSVRTLEPGDEGAIRSIMEASMALDRLPGLTATHIDRALVRIVPDPDGTVVALEDGRIVGYCTPNHDDLTVDPAFRRRGHGRRLVPAALDAVRRHGLDDHLQLYVPPHLQGSVAFADAMGMRYRSSLWRFELGAERAVPPPAFPDDVAVRAFDPAIDADLDAWLRFMLATFEGHPTTMTWTLPVIEHIHAAPDFDPSAILRVSATANGEPIAFALVRLDEPEPGVRTGEIGLVGVLPTWRGRGLGRELVRWGVTELRRRGAGGIELSVEAENERATTLYRRHGFEPTIEWPHWVLPTR